MRCLSSDSHPTVILTDSYTFQMSTFFLKIILIRNISMKIWSISVNTKYLNTWHIIYWYEYIKKRYNEFEKRTKIQKHFFDQTYHCVRWRITILFYRIIRSHHQSLISMIGNIFLIYLENARLQLWFKRRCYHINWSL